MKYTLGSNALPATLTLQCLFTFLVILRIGYALFFPKRYYHHVYAAACQEVGDDVVPSTSGLPSTSTFSGCFLPKSLCLLRHLFIMDKSDPLAKILRFLFVAAGSGKQNANDATESCLGVGVLKAKSIRWEHGKHFVGIGRSLAVNGWDQHGKPLVGSFLKSSFEKEYRSMLQSSSGTAGAQSDDISKAVQWTNEVSVKEYILNTCPSTTTTLAVPTHANKSILKEAPRRYYVHAAAVYQEVGDDVGGDCGLRSDGQSQIPSPSKSVVLPSTSGLPATLSHIFQL
jgi:hypothetical protein